MAQLLEQTEQISTNKQASLSLGQRSQAKPELRQKIDAALQFARDLSPQDCLQEIRKRLLAIQAYCQMSNKTFVFVEEHITCDQYALGGTKHDTAILFRGPSEDASVAICVTGRGSLLHRNSCSWQVYRNAGDVMSNIFLND